MDAASVILAVAALITALGGALYNARETDTLKKTIEKQEARIGELERENKDLQFKLAEVKEQYEEQCKQNTILAGINDELRSLLNGRMIKRKAAE